MSQPSLSVTPKQELEGCVQESGLRTLQGKTEDFVD